MTVPQLKRECEKRNLLNSGARSKLVQRLVAGGCSGGGGGGGGGSGRSAAFLGGIEAPCSPSPGASERSRPPRRTIHPRA
jgi:hypothetical protein